MSEDASPTIIPHKTTNESPKSNIEHSEADVLSTNAQKTADSSEPAIDDTVPFHCKSCGLHEIAHYFGQQPPFVYGVEFCEPTYVMKDPFQAPIPKWKSKAEYFVALGAHCQDCNNTVCKDAECSFFYKTTYCLRCATAAASTFPPDIQQKIKKQLSTHN